MEMTIAATAVVQLAMPTVMPTEITLVLHMLMAAIASQHQIALQELALGLYDKATCRSKTQKSST